MSWVLKDVLVKKEMKFCFGGWETGKRCSFSPMLDGQGSILHQAQEGSSGGTLWPEQPGERVAGKEGPSPTTLGPEVTACGSS